MIFVKGTRDSSYLRHLKLGQRFLGGKMKKKDLLGLFFVKIK